MVQTTGVTPLHVASERGHVEAVAALVDAGAAVNQAMVSVDGGAMGMFAGVRFELYCGGGGGGGGGLRGDCVVLVIDLHVVSDGCGLLCGCVNRPMGGRLCMWRVREDTWRQWLLLLMQARQ